VFYLTIITCKGIYFALSTFLIDITLPQNFKIMKNIFIAQLTLWKQPLSSLFLIIIPLIMVSGCSGEKIFVANFNGNQTGQPPAHNQEVGVVDIMPPNGNCIVAKVPDLPSNWVKISRPDNPQVIAGMISNASVSRGIGKYTFTATLFIPDDGGVPTIQFEPIHQHPPGLDFFHIDFLKNNKIRVNDSEANVFGSFPRNQPFIIQVTLNITSNNSSADIVLSGANTSGQFHVAGFTGSAFAPQFGSVRFWMGYPWVGSFYATNIVLRYQN
jgi:hypothetical protein